MRSTIPPSPCFWTEDSEEIPAFHSCACRYFCHYSLVWLAYSLILWRRESSGRDHHLVYFNISFSCEGRKRREKQDKGISQTAATLLLHCGKPKSIQTVPPDCIYLHKSKCYRPWNSNRHDKYVYKAVDVHRCHCVALSLYSIYQIY